MPNALRHFREQAHLSQTALAAQVGVTRQCIHALEQGRWSPNLDLAYRLAIVLAQPVDVLFPPPRWKPAPPPPEPMLDPTPSDPPETGNTLDPWLL
ncbi:MAG: hypothetical protein OHK005_01370 [Candidatus Methylacidiphilales bacterium]